MSSWPSLCPVCRRNQGGVLGEWINVLALWRCPECRCTYESGAALYSLNAAPEIGHTLGEVTDVDNIIA